MEKYNSLFVRYLSKLPDWQGLVQILFLVFIPFGKLGLDVRG